MAQYDAGSAVATYDLAITSFEAKIQRAIVLYGQLEAAQRNATKPLALPAPSAPAGGGALPAISAGQARAAQTAARVATEQQRAAVVAQRLATEEQNTARALAQADAAQSRAAAAALRLQQAQDRASQGGSRLSGTLTTLKTAAGALGIGFGLKQLVDFGIEAGKNALQLRETQNSLRAVTGSGRAYAEVIRTAHEQQLLFGGSLQQNIEGLSGLTITAKQSGASLRQLVDLSQRLNVLSPEQGVGGARVALAEALSGNISSLSKRFEIPRSALRGLSDESKSVEDRLAILDQFLTKVGVTSAAVAGKVDQDALAFRRLNAELEATQLAAGGQLATAFSSAATGLARLLGVINQNPQAIAELRAIFSGKQQIDDADIQRATADIARNQNRAQLEQAFARARAAQNQGTGVVALGGAGVATANPFATFVAGTQQATSASESMGATLDRLRDRILAVGEGSEQQAASVNSAIAAFSAGSISGAQFEGILDAIAVRSIAGADTEDRRAEAILAAAKAQREAIAAGEQQVEEINNAARAAAQHTIEQRALTAQTALMQAQTNQAVDAFFRLHPNIDAAGIAALAAAGKIEGNLNPSMLRAALLADQATGALERLNRASAGAASFAPPSNALPGTRARGAGGETLGDIFGGGAQQGLARTLQQQTALQQAQFALDLQRARTAAERIAVLRREQAATTDRAEKLRIQAQIEQEMTSGSKSRTSELSKQLNLNERIRDSLESQLKAQLDAAELAIKDRQERRKEEREIRAAQRILASGRASQEFKDAAADRLALIAIDRQQRALALQEKLATAGGTISAQGRVLQSVPGGGPPPPTPPLGLPPQPTPAGPVAPTAAAAGATGPFLIQLILPNGQVLAQAVEPFIFGGMRASLDRVNAGGG